MKRGGTSPIRGAFGLLWSLNAKAIPSAIMWAISFWFVIESKSLLIRSLAVLLASMAAMASSGFVANEWSSTSRIQWKKAFSDRFNWKMVGISGLLLDLSLENLSIVDSRSYLMKIVFLSIFVSCLILWLFVVLVLLPLRILEGRKESPMDTFAKALKLVQFRKRYVFLAFAVIIFAWPIFFVYIFLALTFAQCVITSSYGDLVDASVHSPKKRVQVA